MFGFLKSKKQKDFEANLKLVVALENQLLSILEFVPEHKYKDFFLVSYALFDSVFRIISIEDKEFVELFSGAMGNIASVGKVNTSLYTSAFHEFIDEYMETEFENLTENELKLMQMGAGLIEKPMAGLGISAYFMRDRLA